jgi:hypothetical protein
MIVGYILLVIGCIVGLAGDVMFLNAAYRRSLAWLFGCLFVPFVGEVFLLTHWRAAWRPYVISLLGFAVACIGAVMSQWQPN